MRCRKRFVEHFRRVFRLELLPKSILVFKTRLDALFVRGINTLFGDAHQKNRYCPGAASRRAALKRRVPLRPLNNAQLSATEPLSVVARVLGLRCRSH